MYRYLAIRRVNKTRSRYYSKSNNVCTWFRLEKLVLICYEKWRRKCRGGIALSVWNPILFGVRKFLQFI